MKVTYTPEPELEFNGKLKHIDIRIGIRHLGPLDVAQPSKAQTIRLGVIGSGESANRVIDWLRKCEDGVSEKPSFQPNLFPSFPGYGSESPFKAQLLTEARTTREIPKSAFADLSRVDDSRLLEEAAGLFLDHIKFLDEEAKVDVVVCALPYELLDVLNYAPASDDADHTPTRDDEPRPRRARHNFRAMLKARSMKYRTPLQIVLPATYGSRPKRSKAMRRAREGFEDPLLQRQLQDEATRAWNFFVALYYKGGGAPWRLIRSNAALSSCYIGVGFYRSLDDKHMFSSAAQVFDERGDGQIVRGAAAVIDKDDRTPHLTADDAALILKRSLDAFYLEHHHYPARAVVHKTSYFTPDEIEGMKACASKYKIHRLDLLSIRRSHLRLFRDNAYPPLRGTTWSVDDARTILYTRGSVPFFETYPGMYIPRAMDIQFDETETAGHLLTQEVLALTKMNWNSTQFDHAEPITLEAADQTGHILKYVRSHEGEVERASYRFYM